MQDLLRKPQPTWTEFVFNLIITGIFLVLITHTDIQVHDYYVKPIISDCYPTNQNNFCSDIRQLHGLSSDAQMEIGNIYWGVLLTQAIIISFIVFLTRLFFARLAKGKIDLMTLFVSGLWGFTTISLFLFGFADWGYYVFRGMEVPSTLEWLNDSGVFQLTKHFGTDQSVVEESDLYITMFLGVLVIFIGWISVTHHYRQGTLRKLGLV